MAIGAAKVVIPIIWDMEPSNLPGWLKQIQALDLRGKSPDALRTEVGRIATRVQQKKQTLALVVGGIVLALLLFGSGD